MLDLQLWHPCGQSIDVPTSVLPYQCFPNAPILAYACCHLQHNVVKNAMPHVC